MAPQPVPSGPESVGQHHGNKTGDEMDEARLQNVAYEYLCRLEEVKNWIQRCIGEELPQTTDLEEGLRNGIYLAKLANFFAPDVVPSKKIFDPDFTKYLESGLHFRHTDNINYFLQAVRAIGLPEVFLPETTDVYDKKNMPKVIWCLHALSYFLFKLGISCQIQDLYGKVTFSEEEISNMRSALDAYGLPMPQFKKIGGILASEMPVDEAALHAAIMAINDALSRDSVRNTLRALENPSACLQRIDYKLADKYHLVLKAEREEKIRGASERTLNDSYIPDVYDELLTHGEIQSHINKIGRLLAMESVVEKPTPKSQPKPCVSQKAIVGFQASARGFLVRQKLFAMLQYYYDREHLVVKAQAIWRGVQVRAKYKKQLAEVRRQRPALKPRHFYQRHEESILIIQRAWRRYRINRDFDSLMRNKELDLTVVRKYLHLLDMNSDDFEQELTLQEYKGEISKAIRLNQQLEKDIEAMDIKIGLLVKNRISVQDVVAHSRSMSRKTNLHRKNTFYHGTMDAAQAEQGNTLSKVGLKALKKESRDKLDSYQHLFYLLQTNPSYLAKLVFLMPQTKMTKFMSTVILSLYNFGSNHREEYLLLKLFREALQQEVELKVEKLNDIVSGNPMVVKMIVSFNRNHGKGQNCLKDLLGPLINRVLEDKSLKINTNPVEIYKQWINQMETESGKSSGLPYDVSVAEALEHEEVKRRLNRSISKLKQVTTLFLTTILKSKKKLPYGILYMAKVLFKALQEKFPQTPEKEILKIVGNLIYYRYINSAIIAPDSCDIVVSSSPDQMLNNEQRKNLGSIAKVLQFAASKKGFGEENAHLVCLNQYIIESHEKLREFFRDCCSVQEPEEEFSMDQYSEVTLIAKPMIYISLVELCDTHQMLLDYRFQIAPNENDPLHELLDDLGEKPSLCSLLGATDSGLSSSDASLAQMGETEVCLTLTNKFEVPFSNQLDMDRLFIKTKQMIMSILPCTAENNLMSCLKSKPTEEQIQLYWKLMQIREETDKIAGDHHSALNHTNLFQDDERPLPLDDCKRQILKQLQILERHKYVNKKDGFKSIIKSLGQDIVNQKQYRITRRREIIKLRKTLQTLKKKHHFYQEQVEYYNKYLKQCLASLQTDGKEKKSKKVRFYNAFKHRSSSSLSSQQNMKLKSGHSVRYSGAKLQEKGILLAIEGLPASQNKNVMFEFTPTNENGIFEVGATFMGVEVEHVELDIQELLRLQYEGVSVMNMFGKARININFLLHFLNVKFYGKR